MTQDTKMLIYDEDCPMCSAYTKAFVKTGMLKEEGRKSFTQVDSNIFALIERQKCHNEIPLIDTTTKQVWYGIDALLEILDSRIPLVKTIGNIRPVKWFLRKVYKFISYNRKVIVARQARAGYDCSPDFNLTYRLSFLLFFLFFNSLMLAPLYTGVFSRSFVAGSSPTELQSAHLIFVLVNISSAMFLGRRRAFEYLGQVNMLALIAILGLVPLLFINLLLPMTGSWFTNFYLAVVTLFISRQYIRRMTYAGIIRHHRWVIVVNIASLTIFLTYLSM
jgi:predicted DCC family thiol-disulfide oxidoreductase YuxK